ncbi:hypothetical protein T01_13951 [Trichinella spiralis]|uniref:Secreted protein n=1 Tax=Trichinella spiralis TaxID=6334 RepID=A0A0V1BH17_TRISP|nr:hypothetical protein T01_13951 [Trichinella spiralis]
MAEAVLALLLLLLLRKVGFSSLKILIKPCPNLLAFIWSTSGLLHPRVLRSAGLSPEIPYVEGRMFRNNAHHDWMDGWMDVVELALLPQQQL